MANDPKIDILRALVRPVITLVGFGALTVGLFTHTVTMDIYLPIVSMAIGFYFQSRNS